MTLVVFTSNQPRHAALVRALQGAGHQLLAVFVEPKTFAAPETPALREYWWRVREAERAVFGGDLRINAPVIAVRPGEISALLDACVLGHAATRIVVFSASWITSPLYDMIAQKALNLHAGRWARVGRGAQRSRDHGPVPPRHGCRATRHSRDGTMCGALGREVVRVLV